MDTHSILKHSVFVAKLVSLDECLYCARGGEMQQPRICKGHTSCLTRSSFMRTVNRYQKDPNIRRIQGNPAYLVRQTLLISGQFDRRFANIHLR